MYKLHSFLMLLVALCLSFVRSAPAYADGNVGNANTGHGSSHQNTLLSAETDEASNTLGDTGNSNFDKRVERYAFGLGRRAYMYTNGGAGMKRLPVYNFGLGKRSQPYSFGLGKRADYEDEPAYEGNDYERYNDNGYNDEKRNRPYSFGLGKRQPDEVERRFPNRYGFGLGRR